MKFRPFVWFAVAELLASWFIFRDACWGGSLLAPLDVAATLFYKYKFVDPAASGIPANHYTIDQILADVPLQYTIHHSYRQGKIPWWDPYTYGGMPLLADGHANGTDWVRLLVDLLLPFELAYNWTRILHFALLGLGMFLLLRRWEVKLWISLPMSLAYQFAGCYTLGFQHPFLEGSYGYYAFLWLAWDAYSRRGGLPCILIASLWVAGVLYAGDVQVDTYLVLFALAFGLGYAGSRVAEWKKILPGIVLSGLLGACLAAPVWLAHVELFFEGDRSVQLIRNGLGWLSGFGSLAAVYPWCLGTFRTLDLGKFIGQNSLGFNLFIGSAGFLLAAFGAWSKTHASTTAGPRRAALFLVGIYFLIVSTPLLDVFYTRSAGLAVMALTVLASFGATKLMESRLLFRRSARAILALAIGLALVTHCFAWVVYPRLMPQVKQFVLAHDKTNVSLDSAPALRVFQVENLPAEITFRNRETLFAWLGLVALAVLLLRPSWRNQSACWTGLLILNLLPVLWFCDRYIPHGDIALWRRMLAGGSEQRKVLARLAHTPFRLLEIRPGLHDDVFPGAMSHLYKVRVVHGYSGFQPHSLYSLPADEFAKWPAQTADWIYETKIRGQREGILIPNATPGLARFQWLGGPPRGFTVRDVGLGEIHLDFERGEAGKLLWTDSYYPGWRAKANGMPVRLQKVEPCFSQIEILADTQTLVLSYQPRFLHLGEAIASIGFLGMAALYWRYRRRERSNMLAITW